MIEVKYTIQEGGKIFTWATKVATPMFLLEKYRSQVYFDELALPAGPRFIKLNEHVYVKSILLFVGDKQIGAYHADIDHMECEGKIVIHKGKRV